ncbi:hypothetical protein O9992_22310 [Vibrio lentus]|nr:hypothetical protein [Vibrio lentus]
MSPEFKGSGLLKSVSLSFSNILGETGVSTAIQPLYLPGGILVRRTGCCSNANHAAQHHWLKLFGESSKTLIGAGFCVGVHHPVGSYLH